MTQRRQHLDIKDNFGIKLIVITFNFSSIGNPPNEALRVLLKAQSLLKQSLIDTCMCYLRDFRIQFPMASDLLVHV